MVVEDGSVRYVAMPWDYIRDERDAVLAAAGPASAVGAMVVNDLAALSGAPHIHEIGPIPFVVASAPYFLAREPREVLAKVDWGIILFFATMFLA